MVTDFEAVLTDVANLGMEMSNESNSTADHERIFEAYKSIRDQHDESSDEFSAIKETFWVTYRACLPR